MKENKEEDILFYDRVHDLKDRDKFIRWSRTILLTIVYILVIIGLGYFLGILPMFIGMIIIPSLFPKPFIPTPEIYIVTKNFVFYEKKRLELRDLKIKLHKKRNLVFIVSKWMIILQLYSHQPEKLYDLLIDILKNTSINKS